MRAASQLEHGEHLTVGDRDLAAALLASLQHSGEVERATHGFHTYPAGIHPLAARDLVGLFPAKRLLDPFCGGGTVLVEGRIAGMEVEGRDLSPVAIAVSAARCATPAPEVLTAFRAAARRLAALGRVPREEPPPWLTEPLGEWYAEHVLRELWVIRREIAEITGPERALLEVVFSSLVVKASWRNSDTSAARVKHRRPEGTTAILFHKKARELGRRLEAFSAMVPPGTPPARVVRQDARELRTRAPIDLIVTSPPYPSTYDYLPLQHLRQIWMGGEWDDAYREIGARRQWRREGAKVARRQWAEDTARWTASAAATLRPGGVMIVVIGDGMNPAGVVDSVQPTLDAARAAGLVELARASVARPDHARAAIRWEHAIAVRKPDGRA